MGLQKFFKKLGKKIGKVAKKLSPILEGVAGFIPGAGTVIGIGGALWGGKKQQIINIKKNGALPPEGAYQFTPPILQDGGVGLPPEDVGFKLPKGIPVALLVGAIGLVAIFALAGGVRRSR